MIGSNIFITNKFSFGNLSTKLVKQFKTRVALDGGTFEAESCLKTQLESLNLKMDPSFLSLSEEHNSFIENLTQSAQVSITIII